MLKVMIVDDDRNVRKCLKELIPWEEVECVIVAEANNGIEGLQYFLEMKPDIIITDISMPGMGGEEFCEKIREYSDKVDIIFMSAYEIFSAAKMSAKYGVIDYVLKPINKKKVIEITEILRNLSKNARHSRKLYALMGEEYGRGILVEQLRRKNVEYFVSFFDDMLSYSKKDFLMIKIVMMKMIDILFLVAKEELKPEEEMDYLQICSKMDTLTCTMDIISFVAEIYDRFLRKMNDQSNRVISNFLLEKVKKYIWENIEDPQMSVAMIAEHFDFSYANLGSVFKKYEGVSLVNYIVHMKINYACRMLKNTQYTISEIAQKVGYSNANYFCAVFKKNLDITPNEYRNYLKQRGDIMDEK